MNELIAALDQRFRQVHEDSVQLVREISIDELFRQLSSTNSSPVPSCGEQLLRSAGTIEQTFGGITTNLWDDPFEWTQPETLATQEKVLQYLDEVEATRQRGFDLFKSESDLVKKIVSPSGETHLMALLLDTLMRAAHYQGRARATLELLRAKS